MLHRKLHSHTLLQVQEFRGEIKQFQEAFAPRTISIANLLRLALIKQTVKVNTYLLDPARRHTATQRRLVSSKHKL